VRRSARAPTGSPRRPKPRHPPPVPPTSDSDRTRAVGSRAIEGRADTFFRELPSFDGFSGVVDAANYHPLPGDWALAVADVTGSTAAIGEGRYKAVNMAGAAVISAIQNAVGHHGVPYVFGGDGAVVAVAPQDQEATRTALAGVQTWVREELDLGLRAALVPVPDIRAAGHDVTVARHGTGEVAYAMFAGGGAAWADREMKAGRFLVPAAPAGSRPDLAGLSCRWSPIHARNGTIVSIIAVPAGTAPPEAFSALVTAVLGVLAGEERDGHPVPERGPTFRWPPAGFENEARAREGAGARVRAKRKILFESAVGKANDLTGAKAGGFDARRHRIDAGHNSDFRKFDDGLKLTVDISADACRQVTALLEQGAADGVCRFGMHQQDAALMTCIIPSFRERDHVHFIDGAAGGYAMAATQLKSR
jgi:Protein of unknown function (DUF3095)